MILVGKTNTTSTKNSLFAKNNDFLMFFLVGIISFSYYAALLLAKSWLVLFLRKKKLHHTLVLLLLLLSCIYWCSYTKPTTEISSIKHIYFLKIHIETSESFINETLSDCNTSKFGFPQRSCSEPVVFLGYLCALYVRS